MDLSMAVRVEQDAIIHVVRSSQRTPDDVMVMPSCDFRDFLLADGTDPLLLLPEVQQFSPPLQIVGHLDPQAFFKVGFPERIVRVGLPFDFEMSFDGKRGRVE
jgi:hypothetical protein